MLSTLAMITALVLPAAASDGVCDELGGAEFGLCTAYCEAMACASDVPAADATACDRVYDNFLDRSDGVEPPCIETCEEITVYYDADGDGYGDPSTAATSCADALAPWLVTNGYDCDDGDASINPSAPEISDGVDNNCNALVDEG